MVSVPSEVSAPPGATALFTSNSTSSFGRLVQAGYFAPPPGTLLPWVEGSRCKGRQELRCRAKWPPTPRSANRCAQEYQSPGHRRGRARQGPGLLTKRPAVVPRSERRRNRNLLDERVGRDPVGVARRGEREHHAT